MSKKQKLPHIDEPKTMYRCFVCDQMFRFGPHVYDGGPVQAWGKEMICRRCDAWDGIVPTPQLESKFREKGHQGRIKRKGLHCCPGLANYGTRVTMRLMNPN